MRKTLFLALTMLVMLGLVSFSHQSVFAQKTSLKTSKTAEGHWNRYLDWTISKSAEPTSVEMFEGDKYQIKYTITVTQVGYTDKYRVSGIISIQNDPPETGTDKTAKIAYVDDEIEANTGGNWVSVQTTRLRDYFEIEPGGYVEIPYDIEFTPYPGANSYRNVSHVYLLNHAGSGGIEEKDFIYREDFSIPADYTLFDKCVNVTDTYGTLDPSQVCGEGASQEYVYYRTISCSDADEEGKVTNTASFETNDSQTTDEATATVMVNCYSLNIEKDANTSFSRTYGWTIDKWADKSELTLAVGQSYTGVNYSVKVDATYTDSQWAVAGTITVKNPAPIKAVINSVSDAISGVGAADVDFGVTFPYELPANGTLTGTYSAGLPDAEGRTNTATATLQNYSYDYLKNATPSGTSDFTGTKAFDFSNATINHIDECIDASDTYAGGLGTVCYADGVPKTFSYQRDIGPYSECGDYTVPNTASFVTKEQGITGSDSWTIKVDVPCAGGCTLTQGYWKTHSKKGPAPYDDTWAGIGENTIFFNSGQSYYEVLWTAPKGGNAYYTLAHQYIAAELNFLNDADPTAAQAAFEEASTLFETYTPSEIGKLKGNNPLRNQFINLAETLDNYNNGLIGPGHCDEDNSGGLSKSDALPENDFENLFMETATQIPTKYSLSQNHPNPFNPSTTFTFDIPKETWVKLTVYNVSGQKVASIVNENLNAGHYIYNWQMPASLSSGHYIYRLETADFTGTRSMLFLK